MLLVFMLRRPTEAQRSHFLARQRLSPLTYAEVGATLSTPRVLPDGYHHAVSSRVVGQGDEVFARARDGITRWHPAAAAGIEIFPPDAPIEADATVALLVRLGPLFALAACRIVAVVDEPDRYGFAYGTLPAHPEEGEESFVVSRDDAGSVRFEIVAFSRPHDLLTRLGSPVASRVQARTTRRYLEGLRADVDGG
jgi:uncharacterized protein (UPF0548 family)